MTLRQVRNYIIIFGVVVLGLVALNYYSNTTMNETMQITIELTSLQDVVQSVEKIRDALEEERIAIGQYPLSGNPELLTRIENAQVEYNQGWSIVVANRGETMASQIAEIEAVRETYNGMLTAVITEYQRNPSNNSSSTRLSEAINFYLQNLDPKISGLAEPEIVKLSQRVEVEKERAVTLLRNSQAANLFGFLISGAALIMTLLVVFGTQRMVRSINNIVDAANSISRGDLDVVIDVEQRGEIGEMATAIERMRTSLKAAIVRLRR